MFKLKVLFLLFCLLPYQVFAEETDNDDRNLIEKYSAQGVYAAQKLKKRFELMEKPEFQKAYDNYLKDLKIISRTGKAPDNQPLYNDLLEMDSEKTFVYKQRKGSIRTGFGHVMGADD